MLTWGEAYIVVPSTRQFFLITNNDESRQATRGSTGAFFKGPHFQIKDALDQVSNEKAVEAAKATITSLNLQMTGIRVQD
jgi:hypothetical protein